MKRADKIANSLRKHKRRVINKKKLLLSVVLALLGAELIFALLTSPMFAVKNIKVIGNVTVSDAQVIRALRIPKGSNIFRVDRDSALSEVRRNPVIKEVSLHRRIPSTLMISVTERNPLFTLNTMGSLYEVDAFGIPFRLVKVPKPKLPVIACQVRKKIILGCLIRDTAFASAKECLLLAQAKKVFGGITITVDQKSDICLNIRDDFQVKLGQPEHLARKLDIAEQVIEQTPEFQNRGAYIDVTCPEAPAYKLKD